MNTLATDGSGVCNMSMGNSRVAFANPLPRVSIAPADETCGGHVRKPLNLSREHNKIVEWLSGDRDGRREPEGLLNRLPEARRRG